MAQVSGVEVQGITSICGADVTSIVSIGGISTANIPGWPTGATCTTVYYGFAPLRDDTAPEEACTAEQLPYEWDSSTGLLYNEGGCGRFPAEPGYYSDGTTIYGWVDGGFWENGACVPPPFVGPWVSSIATDNIMGMDSQYPRESLNAIYSSSINLPSIIPSFSGEIWGYSLELSTNSGSSYDTPTYYAGTGSPVASLIDIFALNKAGNRFTLYYFTGYGDNPPHSNKVFISSITSPTPYYGPHPYPDRLFTGQYYRQRIYPFWQDTGSFYETIFNAGDNSIPLSAVSQSNYYSGSRNM